MDVAYAVLARLALEPDPRGRERSSTPAQFFGATYPLANVRPAYEPFF